MACHSMSTHTNPHNLPSSTSSIYQMIVLLVPYDAKWKNLKCDTPSWNDFRVMCRCWSTGSDYIDIAIYRSIPNFKQKMRASNSGPRFKWHSNFDEPKLEYRLSKDAQTSESFIWYKTGTNRMKSGQNKEVSRGRICDLTCNVESTLGFHTECSSVWLWQIKQWQLLLTDQDMRRECEMLNFTALSR